jgi:hypothetical protein
MKKLCLFFIVFFLGLFLFTSPAYACKNKPSIDYVYAEEGMLHIYGSHFSNNLRVKLGGEMLTLTEGEATHNHIQAAIPDKFQNGGTFRLLVSKWFKRRYWGSHWKSAQMDITIAAAGQQRNPGPQDPSGDAGDTTPPTIQNISWPTGDLEFLETHAFVGFDVKDDNEVAFIGIQNLALPDKSKTVSAEPGLPSLSSSEEIPTMPGDNTILIWAVYMFGNVAKEMAIVKRERNCVGCKLRALHMRGADFCDAVLTGADLRDADLSEANLSMAELGGATLNAANLANANLYGVKMADADLKFADLSGADLRDANLPSANMMGANLSGADLTGADLTSANLANANFTGANLTNATVGPSELNGAILRNTLCPDGKTNSDDNGGTCSNNLSP